MAVKDGVKREFSDDPSVHRELWTVDPPMSGRDVRNLQRGLSDRLRPRGFTTKEIPIAAHGKFTYATAMAAIEAQYWLGLREDTYLKRDEHWHRCLTEGAQNIIRDPSKYRTDEILQRAKDRKGNLDEGPRYFDRLMKDLEDVPTKNGADAAVDWALAQVGTKEQPYGSNWGPKVSTWIKLAGYTSPVPWCGCFVNAALMAAGLPSGAGWIGYTPAIISHARRGVDGWRWVGPSQGRPGALALFDTPGGDSAVHVELCRKQLAPNRYSTIGGNTSDDNAGSQANGGMVATREDRYTTGPFRIIGFAIPPY